MARTLHLTNGDAVLDKIRAVAEQAPIIPWRDALHEGPVPSGLGVAALREQRVDFIAGQGGGRRDEILRSFEMRDAALDAALAVADGRRPGPSGPPVDEIVLWFEHDLYDQLQLIQILDRIPVDGGPAVTLVTPPTYLGHVAASEYPSLYASRQPVTTAQRLAARDAWQAFRSPNPRAIEEALARVTALPHLPAALHRHLEQFPSRATGLSRTEQEALAAIRAGAHTLMEAFLRTQEREEAFFMGDLGFFFHLSSLSMSPRPLLNVTAGHHVALTEDGERVLAGDLDRVDYCGIERWLGGVYLSSSAGTPIWRWDAERQRIVS